uniref:DnaB-like helicase C-terminal domain-containing protein n=1 Tax=Acetatifactor sp. TaxID=1872090 RepID=UPI00405705B6
MACEGDAYDEKYTGTSEAGSVNVACRRPQSGKTSLIAELAEYLACIEKPGVIVFSLQYEKQHMLSKYLRSTSNEKLIIDDTPGISITEVRDKCWECRQKQEIKMVFVDYLPLMSGSADCASRVE